MPVEATSWQQWLMAGGSIVLAPVVLFLWVQVDKLKTSVSEVLHKATETATAMDDKVWVEVRDINKRIADHAQLTSHMHLEQTRALADARVQMAQQINDGVEKVLTAIREKN